MKGLWIAAWTGVGDQSTSLGLWFWRGYHSSSFGVPMQGVNPLVAPLLLLQPKPIPLVMPQTVEGREFLNLSWGINYFIQNLVASNFQKKWYIFLNAVHFILFAWSLMYEISFILVPCCLFLLGLAFVFFLVVLINSCVTGKSLAQTILAVILDCGLFYSSALWLSKQKRDRACNIIASNLNSPTSNYYGNHYLFRHR